MSKNLLLISLVSGFLAVLLGAFGAHALKTSLTPQLIETWKTASFYHFVHTVVLLIVLLKQQINPLKQYTTIGLGFLVGLILFSGSLYVYVISQIKLFALITPIGGVFLLLSWAYWFKVELNITR